MLARHGATSSRRASVALVGWFLLASACGAGDAPSSPGAAASGPEGDPPAPVGDLPDLTVASERLAPTTRWETFAPDSCEVEEACVDAPGPRRLLSFSTLVWNVGAADLVLGDPARNPAYELSPCHGHYHLHGFALYQLLDRTGSVVLTGRKQGFCVQDGESLPGTRTAARYADCADQGLSAGWGDLYGAELPCQWIDVTDLAAGTYRLRVSANPDRLFPEARLDNNIASVEVVIDPP